VIDRLDGALISGTKTIEEQVARKDTPLEYELRRQEKSIGILREDILLLMQRIGPILGPLNDESVSPTQDSSGNSQLVRSLALNNDSIENLNAIVLEALKGLEI
jgi:ADP-dependent phosphofructokinase/glucokinase